MFSGLTIKATGIFAVACSFLAAATIWLILSNPVAVATAVNNGDLPAMLSLLTHAFVDAFQALVRYL